jgi:hypothetical protein
MIHLKANADLPNRDITIQHLRKLHPMAEASVAYMKSNTAPCSDVNVVSPPDDSFSWDFPNQIDEIGEWAESIDFQMPDPDPDDQSSIRF